MYFAGMGTSHIVVRDGKKIKVMPGDPLPEAKHWNNLWGMLRSGKVTCDYKDGEPQEGPRNFRQRAGFGVGAAPEVPTQEPEKANGLAETVVANGTTGVDAALDELVGDAVKTVDEPPASIKTTKKR